jgi:multiple sugar transport system ATP-binding protein
MFGIALTNLTKRFGDAVAVRDLTLEVRPGELLVLVGPSGCGKSTLLRLIAGLEQPDTGSIRIGDRVVDDLPPRKRHVAMVFQKHALYPHLNVDQNLAFGLRMRRLPKAEIQRRVRETAEALDIAELLRRKPAELSGGQQQRVALGRAIVQSPVAFLLDEPFSSLDAPLRTKLRAELATLQEQLQTTTIHVTHDPEEAQQLGHRIATMHEGQIKRIQDNR